ncbi:MAG: NTP transferase domain-containing protein [Luteitalea sp.]|nr:NTP transferase domain-containing protein [Luteitalea sp.]
MTAASGAHPELIRCPGHPGAGVAHVHVVAAALAADAKAGIAHGGILAHHSPMISVVVLAAGKSTRMGGRTKALLRLAGGDTFVCRIVRTFLEAGLEEIVIVAGHEAGRVVSAVARDDLGARVVVNELFETGQLSSVLAGLRAVDRPEVEAMMLTLVDVPMVSAATVRAVIQRYRDTRAPIVRPVRGALHGHPVLIDRRLFRALRDADPEEGAKPVVRAHVSDAGDVAVEDPGAFADVDTGDDYERLVKTTS